MGILENQFIIERRLNVLLRKVQKIHSRFCGSHWLNTTTALQTGLPIVGGEINRCSFDSILLQNSLLICMCKSLWPPYSYEGPFVLSTDTYLKKGKKLLLYLSDSARLPKRSKHVAGVRKWRFDKTNCIFKAGRSTSKLSNGLTVASPPCMYHRILESLGLE